MTRHDFSVAVEGGSLHGHTQGKGARILVLHGGPGMSVGYVADLITELSAHHEVATYQQRGLAPTTAMGPYDVDT